MISTSRATVSSRLPSTSSSRAARVRFDPLAAGLKHLAFGGHHLQAVDVAAREPYFTARPPAAFSATLPAIRFVHLRLCDLFAVGAGKKVKGGFAAHLQCVKRILKVE